MRVAGDAATKAHAWTHRTRKRLCLWFLSLQIVVELTNRVEVSIHNDAVTMFALNLAHDVVGDASKDSPGVLHSQRHDRKCKRTTSARIQAL